MEKKLDKFRRLIKKLAIRYGTDDVDVLILQAELNALEAKGEPKLTERRAPHPHPYKFQSVAKQHFYASRDNVAH